MSMQTSTTEEKPSDTALFTALRRTLAYKEYQDSKFGPDHLAEIFLPAYYRLFLRFEKIRENTKNKLAAFMPGMNEYIIARTAYFDELFRNALQADIPQIMVLGAGYDSRAYRFTQANRGTKIYELDAPPTQERKIKCLKAARIRVPAEVHFVPINFMRESLGSVLDKAGYQNRERTLFLWEGVSYYLDREAVKETLSYVSRCAHRNSLIALDYAISVSEENVHEIFGVEQFMMSMREHHAGEAMLFSLKPGEIESFLAEIDLRMIEHLDDAAIERKYLMDERGSLIGRMTGIFRLVTASPGIAR